MPAPKTPDTVDARIAALDEPLRSLAQAVRLALLAAHPQVGEHIKWNSPAFYYMGDMAAFDAREYRRDLAVMHLRKGHVLLVLPTGAKLGTAHPILEGDYADGRCMVTLRDLAELQAKEAALRAVVVDWVSKANDHA